jgi:hypothetical protein
MVPIWEAKGYIGTEEVVRNEARLRRGAFRCLCVPGLARDALDNPWTLLEHLQDVFALIVGQSQPCPEAIDTAWIRRVVDNGDSNRSRWPTDPEWRIVQQAQFAPTPLEVRRLIREQQKTKDIDRRVKVLYGALVSTIALAEPQGERFDISAAIGKVAPLLTEEAALPSKDFGELVRARKHALGVPLRTEDSILPFYAPEPHDEQPDPATLDQEPPEDEVYAHAWWRMEQAERRMIEALDNLDQATRQQLPESAIVAAEDTFHHEAQVFADALSQLGA